MSNNNTYNGWTNRATWLVNLWYGDDLVQYISENDQPMDSSEAEEWTRYAAEECEALSQLPSGLLSDFIEGCWSSVNWHEIATAANEAAEIEVEE